MGRVFFCKVFLAGSMIAPPPRKFSGCHECGLLVGLFQNPGRFIELHNWSLPCYMYPLTPLTKTQEYLPSKVAPGSCHNSPSRIFCAIISPWLFGF